MNYNTVNIELERGLSDENGIQHREVILREMIVKDLLNGIETKNEEKRAVHILAGRILQIGQIKNPGLLLIEKLNLQDYQKIVDAANTMDG